jgi:hypothetical protein
MTKKLVLCASIVTFALLALSGCKSDDASDAEKNDPVLVIDAGQEPRETLRYNIAHGTTTTSNMEYALASMTTTESTASLSVTPGVRLHIVSGPTFEGKGGSTRFDVRIVKAESVVPENTDPMLKLELDKSVAVLNNVGGWVEVDDRGIVQRSDLNSAAKNPDLPARLLMMIVNARTSLSRVVLPAEPIGIGARWEAKKELRIYGFTITQSDTYTLVEKSGDELTLNVQIQQTAPEQTVTFEESGVELTVESLAMNANGVVNLNLRALDANSQASGEAANLLNLKTVEGSEKIEIDRAFDVKMSVTYEIAETIAEGKQTLEAAKSTRKEAEKAGEKIEAAQE